MWLPFDLGKSSKRHEEERRRWRRKAQGDTSVQGEECSGQREWPVQRPGHGTVWGTLGGRRVAGVGAGLWRVNANSKGRHCRDSFCAQAAHVRIHLILATLQGRHFCYPHFTDGGVKALGS